MTDVTVLTSYIKAILSNMNLRSAFHWTVKTALRHL